MGNQQVRSVFLLGIVLLLSACGPETDPVTPDPKHPDPVPYVAVAPPFNEDSAYRYIQQQVDFGPRVPLTISHEKCAAWLQKQLAAFGAVVKVHTGTVTAYNGKNIQLKNIVASFSPEKKKRILLAAHWDTRPMADRDTMNKEKPIDGANDGGSGVGVLLEIARQLGKTPAQVGIDILFFDMEDYGTEYCLGSEYWAKYPHSPGYTAAYGILLDMVGAKNAVFPVEGYSMQMASNVVHKVWETGHQLGYGEYFLWNELQAITDDHVHVNNIAGIPCIDIIHMDPNTGDFGPFHHRHSDNLAIIDKNTLKAVGQTVLEVVYAEKP
ncbi:MAG: M28 family peptidase [Bacteroidia bacterium]|nr:M28 family peptidase [Bacteroidia bacterium]